MVSSRPILLVLDFDGTLTRRDTMHVLAGIGYAHQQASKKASQPRPWSEIVDAYMADFHEHAETYRPKADRRTTLEQEATWLNSLQPLEEASFQRACTAGIWDGITKAEMEKASRDACREGQVKLRDGWQRLTAYVEHHNLACSRQKLPTQILSVNWSKAFITGVIHEAHISRQEAVSSPSSDRWIIHGNEILPSIDDGNIYASDNNILKDITPIRTSGSKVHRLHLLRQMNQTENPMVIYVGDSTTDLECLVAADLGFCIRDDPMGSSQKELCDTCRRIGIEVRRAEDHSQFSGDQDGLSPEQPKVLWSVKDFNQVIEWLDCEIADSTANSS